MRTTPWFLAAALAAALLTAPATAAGPKEVPASELQILLDRSGFSSGEIDGRPGPNTRRALVAFQNTAQLDSTGELDEETEAMLRQAAGRAPLWRNYTLTEDDVKGPFVAIPEDTADKAGLPMLGYSSPLEKIAESFHVAPAFLRKLNPDAQFSAGETLTVPNVRRTGEPLDDGASKASEIEVSKNGNYLLARDDHGKVIFFAPVTSGSRHDPLPLGDWKVKAVTKDPIFVYNPDLFWDAEPGDEKAKLAPGPNNPVGLVWIDLDKEHYGLHGTPDPSTIGHTESHGCVRMTNWDALRVAGLVAVGTPVEFVP